MKNLPLKVVILITVIKLVLARDDLEREDVFHEEEYKSEENQNIYHQIIEKLKENLKTDGKAHKSTNSDAIKHNESPEDDKKAASIENYEKLAVLSRDEKSKDNESTLSNSDEIGTRGIFNTHKSDDNSPLFIEPVESLELENLNETPSFEIKSSEEKSGFIQAEDQLDKLIRIAAKSIVNVAPRVGITPEFTPRLHNVRERNEYPLQIGNVYPNDKAPLLQQNFRSLYNTPLYKPATYNGAKQSSGLEYSPNPYRALSSLEWSSDRNAYPYTAPASVYPVKPYLRNQNLFQQRENLPNYFGMGQSQFKPTSSGIMYSALGQDRLQPITNAAPVPNPFFRYY